MKLKTASIVNISCFGAIRPFKNHLNQAAAAIQFADEMGFELHFHINSSRVEQRGDSILKNLRSTFRYLKNHHLIEHDWMSHEQFIWLIRSQIDMGMQVSFTETYNIVAADHIANNVPVVASAEIPFVCRLFRAQPNHVPSMVRALKIAYYGSFIGLQQLNQKLLCRHTHQSVEAWRKTLKDISE
jgi:hypothetical protein